MRIMKPVDTFISAMMGELAPTGIAWARVGVIVLCVAAAMSFDFGLAVSWKHACFLAGLTFVAAFGPEAAYRAFEMKKWFIGGVASVVAVTLLCIQFGVDQSYTAGIRGNNRDEARVQNMRYDGAQDAVSDDKASNALFRKQLAALMEANAWAGTVKADGLRASLEAAQKAIDLESARGGCKTKCLAEMEKKADLERRIAVAEQAADLAKRIEATQRILDGKREVATKTEHKSSAVVHANTAIAKTVAFFGYGNLKPSESIEEGTDISTNMAMAFSATIVPAFCFLIAVALYRVTRRRDETADAHASQPPVSETGNRTPEPRASTPSDPAPAMNLTRVTVGTINRERLLKLLDGTNIKAAA